jgi:hypothetical protein
MMLSLRKSRATRLALLASSMLLLLSCGKEEKTADSPCASADAIVADASFSSLWTNVFSGRCGSCHGVTSNTGTLGGPDMRTKEAFYAQVVGKTINDYKAWDQAQNIRAGCLDTPLVKDSDAANSLVVAVLDPSVTIAGCTIKSHKEAPQSICISNGSLVNLKKWINNGAANN